MSRPVVISWPGWRAVGLTNGARIVETSPGIWQVPFRSRPYGYRETDTDYTTGGLYVAPGGRLSPFSPWIFPAYANLIEVSCVTAGDYEDDLVLTGTDIWGNAISDPIGAIPADSAPAVSSKQFATLDALTVTAAVPNPGRIDVRNGGVMQSRVIAADYNRAAWDASFQLSRNNNNLGISVYITSFPLGNVGNMYPIDPYMFAPPTNPAQKYALLNTGTELMDFSPVPPCSGIWVEATAQDQGQKFDFAFVQQGIT